MVPFRAGAACLVTLAAAQQAGRVWPEAHPPLPLKTCSHAAGCSAVERTSVTLDAGRRWLHDARQTEVSSAGRFGDCGAQGRWNATLCPDPSSCAANCAVDGLRLSDYQARFGVTSDGNGVRMNYVTGGDRVGSRLYLLDGADQSRYRMFHPKNRELAFDVDISTLECGISASLYFVEMPADGGKGLGNNSAGAPYGLGYCDAHCPRDVPFIGGEANLDGSSGSCCIEMDVFQGNKVATSMSAHPCNTAGLRMCSGTECGDPQQHEYYRGVCDRDGCDFNPYRLGNKSFFGLNAAVDTLHPITVVTQFHTEDGSDSGQLSEIRRLYVQHGRVIGNSGSALREVQGDSITEKLCSQEKAAFVKSRDPYNMAGDYNQFGLMGGLSTMGAAFDRGMVLALSIADDTAQRMQWLDSKLPAGASPEAPGVARGPCELSWGDPVWMRHQLRDSYAQFSNLRFGEIGSTHAGLVSAALAGSTNLALKQRVGGSLRVADGAISLLGFCGVAAVSFVAASLGVASRWRRGPQASEMVAWGDSRAASAERRRTGVDARLLTAGRAGTEFGCE